MAAFPKDSSSPPHEAAIQIDDADEPEPDDEHAQITAGRQIAIRDCSACHAIDGGSTSPHAEAPPLKNALWRFEEDALATHLIEAIRIGHGEMPLFDLSVVGADALIAYLRSIRSSADKQSKQGYGRDE